MQDTPTAQQVSATRQISVLGAGAWGTALALALTERHDVLLWGRNPGAMRLLTEQAENAAYLPGIALPPGLRLSADLDAAQRHASAPGALLIAACPVAALRPLLHQLHGVTQLVWLCKGFEADSGLLPHQVVQQVLGPHVAGGALSGPSFAQEVARGLPCALTIASHSAGLRDDVVSAIHSSNIRVYSSTDVIGVEVGGAVKNVLAIATGMADGLGLGLNARAALITRGLAEITRLGSALGGHSATFMGLTGMGDLLLTCTGDLSRNRQVGLALAQGKRLDAIVAELGHVAEGVPCAKAVHALARQLGVEMPITAAVASVLFEDAQPSAAVARLLARDPRSEAS